jgi:hypothetical protein
MAMPPVLRLFNFSGQPCGMPGEHPCGSDGPVNGGWYTPCGGVRQQVCGYTPGPYVKPDNEMGAYNPDSPNAAAYATAVASGMSISEIAYHNDQARRGLGPPAPGFGPDGQALPPGFDYAPIAYAGLGIAVGSFIAAFVGSHWYYGAAAGGVGGYLYGTFKG